MSDVNGRGPMSPDATPSGTEVPTYPLSVGQRGLWDLQRVHPEMSAYNVPLCLRVTDLDESAFERACRAVLARHPALSTRLHRIGGTPRQSVDPTRKPDLRVIDLSHADDAAAMAAVEHDHRMPFALDGSLLRVRVFRRPRNESIVLLTVHHIVFDGTSARLLLRNLFDAYRELLAGGQPRERGTGRPFAEFVRDEPARIVAARDAALQHWARRLRGAPAALSLPADAPRTGPVDPHAGVTLTTEISSDLVAGVARFAAQASAYPSAVQLAAFATTVAARSGDRELVLGMPVNERDGDRFADTVGFMVTMMPVRVDLADRPVRELVAATQRSVLDDMAHLYPFPALVSELGLTGPAGRSPVFQAAFVYQDVLDGIGEDGGYELLPTLHQTGEYELSVEVWRGVAGATLHWKYHPELFDEAGVRDLAAQYEQVLQRLCDDPSCTVADLRAVCTGPSTAHGLVLATARRWPDRTAVTDQNRTLSYWDLDRRSAALAGALTSRGVQPGDLVALLLDRNVDAVVAVLAVLRAGAAFVPLDPELPNRRLAEILTDSRCRLVVTRPDDAERFTTLFIDPTVEPVVLEERLFEGPPAASHEGRPGDLAYVIYTSGTTGKPKGVMVEHRALVNLLRAMTERPGMHPNDTLLAVTTLSFDMALVELLLPLVSGARVHVATATEVRDVGLLRARIAATRPTVMQATPALWTMLFRTGWRNDEGLRALTGGEALPRSLRDGFLEVGTELWNLYGPTETTVYATGARVHADRPITIGTPVAGLSVHILDARLRPVPTTEIGELCVAGTGLAAGYLNRPELTAERFVRRPDVPGGRLYRTGDLARWTPDGEIEYLGRSDSQVKIRGYRVELGDIEYHLGTHPAVSDGVVVTRGEELATRLVAYYIPNGDEPEPPPASLKAFLRDRLPAYMVPDFLVPIAQFP
ncbi:MAG: non-ribosomal peptide synthetase, partial [Phycicoccus sp.]